MIKDRDTGLHNKYPMSEEALLNYVGYPLSSADYSYIKIHIAS